MRFFKIFIWASLLTMISYFSSQVYQYFQNNYKKNLECIWSHDETIISNYVIEYKDGKPITLNGPLDPFNNISGEDIVFLGKKTSESNDPIGFYIFDDSNYVYADLLNLIILNRDEEYTANCKEK